jgi:hypothetical protein
MFRIPGSPDTTAPIEEIIDFIECETVIKSTVSIRDVIKQFVIQDDEQKVEGINDASDEWFDTKANEIINQFWTRHKCTDNKYPFETEGQFLKIKSDISELDRNLYFFLLLTTRLNMGKEHMHAGYDGTQLFEYLSAKVAESYFGYRAESMVFGTAEQGGFKAKIQDLINKIGEGVSFINRGIGSVNANDDKLDIVVWKNFKDESYSKLIGFGQCKTGLSWLNRGPAVFNPSTFCKKWFSQQPSPIPTKLFFCSVYFAVNDYNKISEAEGIIFDRFRIMDYLPTNFEEPLYTRICAWNKAALEYVNRRSNDLRTV